MFAWGHRLTLGCHNGNPSIIKEMMNNDTMLTQYTSLLLHSKVKQHYHLHLRVALNAGSISLLT